MYVICEQLFLSLCVFFVSLRRRNVRCNHRNTFVTDQMMKSSNPVLKSPSNGGSSVASTATNSLLLISRTASETSSSSSSLSSSSSSVLTTHTHASSYTCNTTTTTTTTDGNSSNSAMSSCHTSNDHDADSDHRAISIMKIAVGVTNNLKPPPVSQGTIT